MHSFQVAVIKGDGIGIDVTNSAMAIAEATCRVLANITIDWQFIEAGAGYYRDNGIDIEPDGEQKADAADAIFLGAIGLPRHSP